MPKGHTNNPNGRPKGARNRLGNDLRAFVHRLIEENRSTIESDLRKIDCPATRLSILERYLQYTLPKLQSVSIETQIKAEYDALESFLIKAPDNVVSQLAEKVKSLAEISKQIENV